MPTSGPFERAVEDKRIHVLYLPPGMDMTDYISVSVFWTRPWLWEQLQGVDKVLTFQIDSIVCSKANVTADDFLEWDYIGAPLRRCWDAVTMGAFLFETPRSSWAW